MRLNLSLGFGIILGSSLLISCATQAPHPEASYHDSAFNDHNRAPASMTPPLFVADGVDQLDPVYMRTQGDYYFSMGEAQSLEGQHQKALESFKMVLVYDPESPQVQLRLAAEYIKLGMFTQALEHAEICVKKNPKLVDGRLLLGGLYSSLKVYDRAIFQYNEILKIDPKNTEAPLYMGAVYAEQKKYDQAVKYFESLVKNENYPTPHLAWYYIGRVRSEQPEKAYQKASEEAFKKALEASPSHLESLIALGSYYSKWHQEKKAFDLFKKFQAEQGPNPKLAELLSKMYLEQEQYDLALEQLEILERYSDDPLNAKLKVSLVYIEQKKYMDAIVKLKDVLAQVPESDKIRFYLAAIYEEINQNSDAVENFVKIPPESQFYGEAMVHAAYLLKQDKKVDEALKIVNSAIEKRPDVGQLYAIQGSLYDEKGNFKKAAEVLKTGVDKFPENVQLRFFYGTIQDRLGNKPGVVDNMKKVIEMDPNHVQGLNYLAFTYAESGKNLSEAEKLIRRAIEIEPRDGYILDTLGWILFQKGDVQQSIQVLEAAFKFQPKESIIAEHLGDAYKKFQMVEKARKMYMKAAENEVDETKQKEIREKLTSLDKQDINPSSSRTPASVGSSPNK
jgi:tetratricopeptide (TPR) repeat protein